MPSVVEFASWLILAPHRLGSRAPHVTIASPRFSVESGPHEYADPLDRSPSLWDDARVVLPTVRHTRPFLEFDLAASSTALFSHPHGIVAQDFIAANLDEQWRKSRCVPVKR